MTAPLPHTLAPAVQAQLSRWYRLKPIPEQLRWMYGGARFNVVPAGRRSGKTERAKRKLAKAAMRNAGELYFACAPTHDQAKKIWWRDLNLLTLSATHHRPPSKSERIIYMPNGTELHVFGLDKPERMEGIPWTGGCIDEIANAKPEAWAENIRPALDTLHPDRPKYRAWCDLIGVPEGLNHYYDMAEYAKTGGDPEWALFHWKSAEVLPPEVIEAARRQLSAKQFRQEYEASFETASGRVYEDYGVENVCTEVIYPHEQLLWCHDFNFTPLSSAICVRRGGDFYVLDEIVLTSAVAKQSAKEFINRYADHLNRKLLLYGDPAGRAGEKHGHSSDYKEIESTLRQAGWEVTRRVRAGAPAIKDRQNALRARICNAAEERHLFVNPNKAEYCHKGLNTVLLKSGSTFLEQDGEYQHITTALGYMVEYECPIRHDVIDTTTARDFENELDYSL